MSSTICTHRRLARFLMRMTSRYDLAEEIINDTFWVIWQHAADFRGALGTVDLDFWHCLPSGAEDPEAGTARSAGRGGRGSGAGR